MVDVAWAHGSLVPPATPVAPASLDDGTAAAVLDDAEQIVRTATVPVLLVRGIKQQIEDRKGKLDCTGFANRRGRDLALQPN